MDYFTQWTEKDAKGVIILSPPPLHPVAQTAGSILPFPECICRYYTHGLKLRMCTQWVLQNSSVLSIPSPSAGPPESNQRHNIVLSQAWPLFPLLHLLFARVFTLCFSAIGKQGPPDVHVVSKSTTSLRPLTGRTKRSVSL